MGNFVTADDVRSYVLDHQVRSNAFDLDLAFEEKEIQDAMVRAAREYNSVPPLAFTTDPDRMSATTNCFLDGTAQQLYLALYQKLTREDRPYTAGSVTTDITARQIQHVTNSIKIFGDRFRETARNIKLNLNIRSASGPVG